MAELVIIFIRSLILFIILFFLTKILRRKHLSQLSVFDYINGIVAGGIVAITTTKTEEFSYGIIALLVWFGIPFIIDFITLKSKRARDFTHGKSTVLIEDGKIMEENLQKTAFSAEDLLHQLRSKHIFHVNDVEFALLEPTGEVTVLPKAHKRPLTAEHMNIKVPNRKEAKTIIMDGEMLLGPLSKTGLPPSWLHNQLASQNLSIENVFLGQLDEHGQLYIDLYDDEIPLSQSVEKPLLLATLKKIEADLQLFSLATNNIQSKEIYEQNYKLIKSVINETKHFLQ